MRASQRLRSRKGRPDGSVDLSGKTLPVMGPGYARDKAALHIGEAIQRERERMEVAADELAARLELAVGTVHGWERGAACPSVANLLRVAWALGVPVSRLVEECE